MPFTPLFPSLTPALINPIWFNVDSPCDDESEVTAMEMEHLSWLNSISQTNFDAIPIGKMAAEHLSEDADTDDEDANDDTDDTDSQDDEEEVIDFEAPRGDFSPRSPILVLGREGPQGQPQNIAGQHSVR